MTPSSMPRVAGREHRSTMPWNLHGHGTRASLLLVAMVFVGGYPPSSFLPSSSSSMATRGNGFMLSAEAVASAIDTPATALGDATTKKPLEGVEEDELLSSKHGDISGGSKPLPLERKLRPDVRTEDDSDSLDLYFDSISSSIPTVLLEGCLIPAEMTSVKVKHDKPKTGNIAEHAIDGDPSTWWGRRGINRWMDIEFEGGEDGDSDVSGVAIAFLRGHRRSAFFDMTLYDKYDNVVAKKKDLESGGQTQDYETFSFEEHAEGSKVRLDFKGTTAGIWNAVAEVSICLNNIVTPAPVSPPTVPPLTSSGLTYVGCFMDDDTGLTRFLDDKSMQDENLTPQSCAEFCSGYKYMALQYSQDCFCAETYYTAERDAIPTDTCNMPCRGDENVICGGPWSNSIYIVGDPTEMTEEELAAQEGPKESDGVPRRKFTVINSCFEQVRLGATGGYVKALDDPTVESCPEGSVLDKAVGACFWGLPLPEDGKTFDIEPGGSLEVILDNNAVNGVRWSGNMWAATGCHSKVGCETASCLRNIGYPDGYCPPSTGPTGPVTKAEFTLVDTGVDYYDVTAIDGVNVPVEMKPDPLSSPLEKLEDPYWCSNPGGVTSMSEELEGCTWEFDATEIDGFPDHDMSMYLRWVRNDGLFAGCEDDSDCEDVEGEGVGQKLKCGALFGQDTLNGGVTEEMFPKKCGSNLGWHSPNAICGNSRSKPLGYFPNSFPFMCDKHTMQVIGDNSTYSDIYGCAGPIYGLSGYSRNADDTACGCPDWPALGINAPSESTCYGKNPYWEALSVPWLKYLKRACPTAYCFPYDDHSSTFVCRNEDENNDHDGKNSMSYIIEFCPGDSQGNLLEW